MNTLKKDLYNMRYALIILIIYFLFIHYFFNTICPFKIIFGIDCPGCGLTRGCLYLITGNFKKAIEMNLTSPLWLLTIILFIIDRYFYKLRIKVFPNIFIGVSIITIIWYFVKMFL